MIKIFGRKTKRPQPTGTSQFIDNIHWWYWDGTRTPGLLTRDSFDKLMVSALPPEEQAEFILSFSTMVTLGQKNFDREKRAKAFLTKMGTHLERIQTSNQVYFDEIVMKKWIRPNVKEPLLDVFKAYLNVLEYWGYPYSWQSIKDARHLDAGIVLLVNGKPSHCIAEEDVGEITGRPHAFSVWMNGVNKGERRIGGGNWHFRHDDGGFDMSVAEHSNL